MKKSPFRFDLGPVAPLIAAAQRDYRVSRDVALSMVISEGKTHGISFSAEGWPYDCRAVATRKTNLRSVASFLYVFGFRLVWQTNALVPA